MSGPPNEAGLSIAAEPADSADAVWCVSQYYAELARRFDGGFDGANAGYAGTAQESGFEYFVVARIGGAAIGCGMLRSLDDGVAEVKRVWTSPDARGKGVARAIMDRLEAVAADNGFRAIRLDTNRVLTEARAFYVKRGYREIGRYNDNPYADHWFEKGL